MFHSFEEQFSFEFSPKKKRKGKKAELKFGAGNGGVDKHLGREDSA